MLQELTRRFLAVMLVFHAGSVSAAQTAKTPAKAPGDDNKQIRLNGCISRDTIVPTQFNFLDNEAGEKYRLTGKNLKKFVGRRVEIVGGPPGKGVTFKTGLYPSPNVAAQAGAIDPAKAAIANLPGGAADAPAASLLPEFRVTRLRAVDGACQ
jgi:hypothetical protein